MNNPLNEEILHQLVVSGEWRIDDQGHIWKNLKRIEHQTGEYLQVRKMIHGIRLTTGAHRLVYYHFKGKIPPGMTINHLNGIKTDNRPENLEIATYSENLKHAFLLGLADETGQKNPHAKLSDQQVDQIRTRYFQGGITQMDLAKEYGVAYQTISKIVRGNARKSQSGITMDYTTRRKHQNKKRGRDGKFVS